MPLSPEQPGRSPDSTSSSGSPIAANRQKAIQVIDQRIDLKLVPTNQEIGRQLALLQSKLDAISSRLDTVRLDNNELRTNLIELHTEYKEVREYAQAASNSAAAATASNKVIARTIDRMDLQAEITNAFLDLLVPLYRWLTKIFEKRAALDPRNYTKRGDLRDLPTTPRAERRE